MHREGRHTDSSSGSGSFTAQSAVSEENGVGTRIKLPLVTVAVTNHNYAAFVPSALRSVAQQTYRNIECIVVDDASDDGSVAEIERYIGRSSHPCRLLRLDRNLGQMGAMKVAAEAAQGEFIAFLDADDVLFPTFVETHVRVHLNRAYSAGISASDTIQVDANDVVIEGTFHSLPKTRGEPAGTSAWDVDAEYLPTFANDLLVANRFESLRVRYIERHQLGWHGVAMSAFMFRRDLVLLVLPRDIELLRICADYYLALYAHLMAGTLSISLPLGLFRLHGGNRFSNNPVIGGPHRPGHFSETLRKRIEAAIVDHLVENAPKLSRIIGVDMCRSIASKLGATGRSLAVFDNIESEELRRSASPLRRTWPGQLAKLMFWRS